MEEKDDSKNGMRYMVYIWMRKMFNQLRNELAPLSKLKIMSRDDTLEFASQVLDAMEWTIGVLRKELAAKRVEEVDEV